MLRGGAHRSSGPGAVHGNSKTVEQEIEVAVPVATAYKQWTQFEEFPSFMEGVDEVKQLDNSLLHWAATVGGKKAEWEAKIVEQEPEPPDRLGVGRRQEHARHRQLRGGRAVDRPASV